MLISNHPAGSTPQPAQPDGSGGDEQSGIGKVRKLNARQAFAFRLIRDGLAKSQAEAYRIAYCKPNVDAKKAADAAWRLFSKPNMQAALDTIRFDGCAPLMSLQDRLGHLAAIIASPTATRYERIRAAEVYTKIAGDGAPELPPDPNARGDDLNPRRVVINIFATAPTRMKSVIPERNVTPLGNGNGNGNGHH